MSIEKSLYAAPEGLEGLMGTEPDIEIEIEDPESVLIEMDGVEIELMGGEDEDFDANLVEFLPDNVVAGIVTDLVSDFDDDVIFLAAVTCVGAPPHNVVFESCW